jgi:ADP-heptose:LPS heptosyltransferase
MPVTSPSVLIIRLDAIGDALALTPMLAALRERAIPADAMLHSRNAGVFSSRALREAIVADDVVLRAPGAQADVIAAWGSVLRQRAFTHVLVATEDAAGYRLAKATGAPVRVGFSHRWGKPFKALWCRNFVNRTVYRSAGLDRKAPHECEVLFRLARPLLGDAIPTRDAASLRPLVIEREPGPEAGRIVLQVTDKWQRSGMTLSAVVRLAGALAGSGPVRFLAARDEAAFADRFAHEAGVKVEQFGELEAWKEAIAGARVVVAPDSGAVHVAGMVGTPVVAVFPGGRDSALQIARWSPWAAPYRVVLDDDGWPERAAACAAELLAGRQAAGG